MRPIGARIMRAKLSQRACGRFFSVMKSQVGVVLDIDGVLLKGKNVIKSAPIALRKLQKHGIPYIFVTNGGGMMESTKAKDLEKKLGLDNAQGKVLLSHTPYKELAREYSNRRILVLGHEGCVDIAHDYGFKKVVTARQLHAETPTIYPRKPKTVQSPSHPSEKVAAIFVFHDPLEWALEMQICIDLLHNNDTNEQDIPLYACNADLVYNTEHDKPRLTQGAFIEAFRHLYELRTGIPLAIHFCGKPFTVQYRLAEQLLNLECEKLKTSNTISTYIGIGDNPQSDIRGARNAGANWISILVKTGVWNSLNSNNDPIDPADVVVEDVSEAVDWIVRLSLNE